jgi:hypothetical protein
MFVMGKVLSAQLSVRSQDRNDRGGVAFSKMTAYFQKMSVAELKKEVDALSPQELAELAAYIAARDNEKWDKQIDEDFAEGGRLCHVLDEVREDIKGGRFTEMP